MTRINKPQDVSSLVCLVAMLATLLVVVSVACSREPGPESAPNPTPTITLITTTFRAATHTPTVTATPVPEPTATVTRAPTSTPTPTETPVPTVTVSPTPSPTATASPTPEPTASPQPSPIPTVFPTATASPTPEPTVTPQPSPTPTVIPTATASPTPEPTATPLPTPTPTPSILPDTTGTREFEDPDVPYLKWEVGPDVSGEHFQHFRRGILDMHRYASSLGLPPLPDYATFYIYHDPESAARTIARLERRRLEDARQKFVDDRWAGLAGLELENEDSGWIMVNLLAFVRYPESRRYMRVAAHELSHVYQYTLQRHGRFDTTHREVRVIGPAWMQEGFATFHSDRALAMGGVVSYEQSRQKLIGQSRQVDVQLEETETYDGLRAGPGRYDMAAMASELLAAKVGEEALISFWTLLGPDTPWREAFEAAFGMTVEEFYPLFEEHRADGFPELDLPDIAPRTPLATADREALAALYDATGGVHWENNDNWLTDEPGSSWYGVTADREGYVTLLDLRDNRLSGELPPELGNLSRLRELRLRENQLNGEIPPELGNLFNLEVLSLVRNRLSGPIPSGLGNLAFLKELSVRGNELNGQIPSSLANLSLLRNFSVGVNELTGEIPSWLGDLPILQSIHLGDNQLTGAIPDNLANLTDVRYFNVIRNRLTGDIPSWLADFPLQQLFLNDNQLTGDIPLWLADLPDLEWLWLGGNSLSGCVPGALRDIPNNDMDRLGLPDC